MSVYLTGRTRTLTVAGDITAILRGYAGTAPTYDIDGNCVPGTGIAGNSGISSGYIVSPWGGTIEWVHHDPAYAPTGEYGWELAIMPVAGGTVKTFLVTDTITPPTNITANATGEFTFVVEVEECFEVQDVPAGMTDTIDSREWVNYGGTGYPDGLVSEGTQVEYFERIVDGSDMTVTLSWDAGAAGTGSDSQTDVAGASIPITAYDVVTHQEGNVGNYIQNCSIEYDFLESIGPNFVETENGTYNSARGTLSYTTGTRKMLALLELGYLGTVVTDYCDLATATAYGNGQLDNDIYPVKRYALSGRIRAFDQAFPDSLDVLWVNKANYPVENEQSVSGTGSYSDTSIQHEYITAMLLNGVDQSAPTLLEYAAPRCYIDPASLTTRGDDSRDWRLMILGKPYLSHTIKHEASTVIENGSSATGWTAGSNTTITSVSGAIHLVAAGGAGSGYKTWSTALNAEGYRFMKFRLKSVVNASQLLTLTFTVPSVGACTESKVFQVTTGAANTFTDVTIDLLLNESRAVSVEGTESHFPLTSSTGVPENSPDFWGLNVLDRMTISGIADGETIDIDYIELVRTTETPLNSWLPSFNNWKAAWTTGTATNQKAFWWGDVAGRITGETDMYQVNSPKSYYYNTITNLYDKINAIEGYTMTVAGSFPSDGFHTNSQPALWTFGGGVCYHDTDWHYGVDVDITSVVDIYAQALWDRVTVYPACGDCWERSTYGALDEATPIRFGKHLRCQAWGDVFNATAAASGSTIHIWTDPLDVDRGSGTSNSLGYYKTGLSFARGNLAHKVSPVATSVVNRVLKNPTANRMRHRAILAPLATNRLAIDSSPSKNHVRAFIDSAVACYGKADNTLTWSDATTSKDADTDVALCLSQGKNLNITLLTAYTGAVNMYTLDNTGTWSGATSIGNGDFVSIIEDKNTLRYIYWNDSGTIKGKILDSSGTVVEATFNAVTGVDSDSDVDVTSNTSSSAGWRVVMLVYIGGTLTTKTSVDGVTFI